MNNLCFSQTYHLSFSYISNQTSTSVFNIAVIFPVFYIGTYIMVKCISIYFTLILDAISECIINYYK